MKLTLTKRILIFIPTAFLFLHLSSLSYIIIENVYDRPYFNAKINFSVSQFINEFYLIPVGKITGTYSTLSNPIRSIRDYFFETGDSFLPKDEVERAIWYFRIISYEFVKLQVPDMNRFVRDGSIVEKKQYYEPYYKKQIDVINKLFQIDPLKDKVFKKKRYYAALSGAANYISAWPLIYSVRRGKMDEIINNYPFMKNKINRENIFNFLIGVNKLQKYYKTNYPKFWEGYKNSRRSILEYKFFLKFFGLFVVFNSNNLENLDCSDLNTKAYVSKAYGLMDDLSKYTENQLKYFDTQFHTNIKKAIKNKKCQQLYASEGKQ